MKFYSLEPTEKKGVVKIETLVDFSVSEHIPLDSELIGNNNFTISEGKKLYDIIEFADSFAHFAISEKFKQLLINNNVNGWTCFPINIKNINENFYVFQITSHAGKIQNIRELNNYSDDKIQFDINSWDGSDIFSFNESLYIICTEKVIELIKKEKITNLNYNLI